MTQPSRASERTLDLEAATRAALALAVPLLVLLAVDRIELAVYASFGAFTGLYGRHEPYRVRLVSVTAAAVGLVASIAAPVPACCAPSASRSDGLSGRHANDP